MKFLMISKIFSGEDEELKITARSRDSEDVAVGHFGVICVGVFDIRVSHLLG